VRGRQPRAPFPASNLDRITAQSESGNRDYSGGAPVRSPKGALFAMQVMPDTARAPGFGVRPARSASPDEYNRVGRDYRAAMERRYGGDPAKMWAAYNWGPGNLDNALSRYGEAWLNYAPAETRRYVQQNLRALGRR
jgi:soluble lytic murein transglycosylase